MITRMAVITGKSLRKLSLTQRMLEKTSQRPAVKQKSRNSATPPTVSARPASLRFAYHCRAGPGDAESDGDDHPAAGVLHDGGGDDHLAQIAPHEIHFPDHHGHDLDGGNGKGSPQKQRRHQPAAGAAEQNRRAELAQQETAGERKGDAAKRDGDGGERRISSPA